MKVKVRYAFNMKLSFAGEIEIEEEEFKRLDKLSKEKLAEALSVYTNPCDPTDWNYEDVDEFCKIGENK